MSKRISRGFARFAIPVLAPVLAAACAGPALAQSIEGSGPSSVMMFDRPPTVDELRDVVSPDPPRRTRAIEIIGNATSERKRPQPATPTAYTPPPAANPAPAPAPARPVTQQAAAPAEPPAGPAGETPTANAFGFRINFAFNSADIPSAFHPHIDSVGGLMAQEGDLNLVIEGHTDAIGNEQYNRALSERRAIAVGEYLVRRHGIAPQRIVIAGKGEAQPLTGDPTDGRNRRVEFKPSR